jgi:hypothetical protein
MNDLYSKIVVTVIAISLSVIAAEQWVNGARAASDCGSMFDPCYVTTQGALPVYVR